MTYLIALIVFALPSYLIRFSIFGIPTTLLEVLIYIAAIITIIKFSIFNFQFSNKSQFSIFKQKQILIPIILFILAGIISIIVAPDKRDALGLFKAYIFDPILFFFVILLNFKKDNFQFSISNFQLIFKALIISGTIVAMYAIWQKLTGQVTIDGRVIGLFGHSPNYLALYLAPIAVLTFGCEMLLVNNNYTFKNYLTKRIWIYDLALLAMLLATWFSGSRAAIGAVAVGIISFLVFRYWSWIRARKIIVSLLPCFIVTLLILGWLTVKPNWQATREGGRIASSNNIRWEIWQTTVRDIIPVNSNWLLGIGLGNYQNYFIDLTKSRVNYPEWIAPMALTPHNLFLNIWLNLGILGLGAFLWLLYLFFQFSIFHFQFSKNKTLIAYRLSLIVAMITIVVHGFVDTPYWKNDLAVMFWIFLALAYVLDKIEKEYA